MRFLLPLVLVSTSLVSFAQDAVETPEGPVSATRVEDLRERIHSMRKNLLLGGDQVRKAESEAVDFYYKKIEAVEGRRDRLHADITEARASYEVVLERALTDDSAEVRRSSMKEAGELRTRIAALEKESATLAKRRKGLSNLVGSVESRENERERLALQMDSGGGDEDLGLAFGGLTLAAPEIETSAPSVFDDERLVQDLLTRQPVEARRVLFEADPVRYWQRFKLQPPSSVLRTSLTFPTPDPPGYR